MLFNKSKEGFGEWQMLGYADDVTVITRGEILGETSQKFRDVVRRYNLMANTKKTVYMANTMIIKIEELNFKRVEFFIYLGVRVNIGGNLNYQRQEERFCLLDFSQKSGEHTYCQQQDTMEQQFEINVKVKLHNGKSQKGFHSKKKLDLEKAFQKKSYQQSQDGWKMIHQNKDTQLTKTKNARQMVFKKKLRKDNNSETLLKNRNYNKLITHFHILLITILNYTFPKIYF